MSHVIQTYTGRSFDILDPNPDDIDIADIARALSMQARFSGHMTNFYSVAEHSFRTSKIVPKEHALAALLHDASEAYIGDMASPLKRYTAMGSMYMNIEDKLMRAIADRFNFTWPLSDEVKKADLAMLCTERRDLLKEAHDPELWSAWASDDNAIPARILPFSWRGAEMLFLLRYAVLKRGGR